MPRSRNLRLKLDSTQQDELQRLIQLPSIPAIVYRRARAILLLSQGSRYKQAASIADLDRVNIFRWVKRYLAGGIASLRNSERKNGKWINYTATHEWTPVNRRIEMSFAGMLRELKARNAALARNGLLEQQQVQADFY